MRARVTLLILTVLAWTVCLSTSALAQDDPKRPAERSAVWFTWSHEFAQELEQEDRITDAIEEYMISGQYSAEERDPWARAALLAVRQADRPEEDFTPGSSFYRMASVSIEQAVRLTTAAELKADKRDPRVSYAIGRLRFVDAVQPANVTRMGELMTLCVKSFGGAIKNAELAGFDAELAKPWYFRSAVNLGQVLTRDNRFAEARVILDDAHDRYGDLKSLTPLDRRFGLIARAELFRALDERENAEKTYLAIIKDFPGSPRAHLGLARVLFDQSKLEDALTHLQKSATSAQRVRSEEATLVEALITAVSICLKLDPPKVKRAERLLDQYEILRKEHPDALYMRGLIALEREQWAVARSLFRRVSRLLPSDRPALVGLQQALQALSEPGDKTEREAVAKRILAIDAADALEKSKKSKKSKPAPDEPSSAPPKDPTPVQPAK